MIFLQNFMEAGSRSKNIMTDRLDLGERYISKNYTSQVNQALDRCFFLFFSENLGRELSTIFGHHACMY